MKPLRTLWSKMRSLWNRRSVEREIDEELRLHLEERTAENIADGMTPEEAAREARKRFGNLQTLREDSRAARGTNFGESTWQDLRFGARMLRKNPGFSIVAILTLALGIGATTAIYSVVNTVLLNPVPAREPERLFEIGERSHGNKDEPRFGGITTRALELLKTQTNFFADVVWVERFDIERRSEDFIEIIGGSAVSPNFFNPWDIKPILGRAFVRDEAARRRDWDSIDRDTTMVLSYSLWQSRFGGQRDVLGKTIETKGRRFTIVGVMPKHFQFPDGAYPTFWIPIQDTIPDEELGNIKALVRLQPGVTVAQTESMLESVARQLKTEQPKVYDDEWHRRGQGFGLLMQPLSDGFTRRPYGAQSLQRTLYGLLAAIGFILMIGCINVANLMLARTEKRQQELAVRAAIGASRTRLMRQVLTESLLLAICGSIAGLVVTFFGIRGLVLLIPEHMPRLRAVEVDGAALSVAVLVSFAAALIFGAVPAWLAGRSTVKQALSNSGTSSSSGVAWRWYRGGLVVAEMALSLVLLTGAGLMIESVVRLLHVNPGFDPQNLLFANPGLFRDEKYKGKKNESGAVEELTYEQMREHFAALPGVKAVGVIKYQFAGTGYTIDGRDEPVALMPGGTGVGAGDAFRAMHTPLLAGRYLEKDDVGDKVGTVVINDTMARMCWPGDSPLGKKFRNRGGRVFEVVGIVADARIDSYDGKIEPIFFRPYYEQAWTGGRGPFFIVRTETDPQNLIAAMRDEMKAVEPNMTTPSFQVIRQTLYDATVAQRTYMLYLVIFAAVGLMLAAIGVYGVLAYSVARRTREIGIRMAVGAEPGQVLRMVMKEGLQLAALGAVGGLVAAFWLTQLLRSELFGVSPTDPGVMAGAVVVLGVVAAVACLLPAIRAVRINPMTALRYE